MTDSLPEELIDAVYRAALEPAAWNDVMQLMKHSFPSAAQTFYFLHLEPHRVQPVCLAGVEPGWVRSFDELYFAPDNPWIRLTRRLHRTGVVRTNERLEDLLHDHGVLYRSSYYNDWMRPQGFKYTLGNTLLAERDMVANITLLRAPDMKTFGDAQVRAFELLSKHMTRALQIATRLERPQACPASTAAFDAMPQAIALVDAQRRVLYANAGMENLLRGKHGLSVQQGELNATDPRVQQQFAAYIAGALSRVKGQAGGHEPLLLPHGRPGHLTLHAMPVIGSMGRSFLSKPTVLLLATDHSGQQPVSRSAISQLYGCTPSEARLAQLLAEGNGLRQSAGQMGVTYGTARVYLKIVFDKIGVRTQAQLVARVIGDLRATPVA